jgi:hypothetical protein
MTNPAPADGTRWRGYSHKDLYTMLHDGPGAAASAEPSRRWAEISATLTEIGQDLQKALTLTGTAWQGRAAGAAYDRLSTSVAWATASGTSAAALRTAVEDQAEHIARARADMPAPADVPAQQPDPTVPPAVQVVQTQTDAEPAEAAASSAEERAVEVMTAYETATNGTTTALAKFDVPPEVVPNTRIHQGIGTGLAGIGATVVAGLTGGGSRDKDNDRRNDGRGGGSRGGDGYPGQTNRSSSPYDGPGRRPQMPYSPPGPGRMTGVSSDPFFAMPNSNNSGNDRSNERSPGRTAGVGNPGGGSGGGGVPGAGPKTGLGGMPTPELQQAQQAAAASQAATGAHPAAGTPIAPATGAAGGGAEKMAMRRFGMEAIGSSQWFGDVEEPVPGQSPKRRFDLRESAESSNESVSILDEENQLPPGVIGEGGR